MDYREAKEYCAMLMVCRKGIDKAFKVAKANAVIASPKSIIVNKPIININKPIKPEIS